MLWTLTRNLAVTAVLVTSGIAALNNQAQDNTATAVLAPPTKATLAAPMYVAGYSVRTTNAAEATGQGELPKLWTRFFQEGLADQIPHRSNQNLMVVYSDYSSDEKGEYTYLLGAQVDSIEGLPKDMIYRKIPAGPYAVITSPRGPLQEILPATWMQIWKMTPADLGGKRTFQMDYEVYDERAADPSSGQVEVHLGITPAK